MPKTPLNKVVDLPLSKIDLDDQTYMFRAQLRLTKLKESIDRDGVQIPVIVRPKADGYQLVAGFRRCTASTDLGRETVPGIVRELSDDEALRLCLLENIERKTYSKIDQAWVIRRHAEHGKTQDEIGEILGLRDRQIRNIKALLELPEFVQDAIEDEDGENASFSATHAITLSTLAAKYERTGRKLTAFFKEWIPEIAENGLSVQQLTRAVNAKYGSGSGKDFTGLLNPKGTEEGERVFRLKPVKLELGKMTAKGRKALRTDLEKILAALDEEEGT